MSERSGLKPSEQDSIEAPGNMPRRTIIAVAVCAIAAVACVFMTQALGGSYYLSTTLIMILALIPFFLSFEGSSASATNLALLAALSALSVASRIAFFWLPNFSPMLGIVMLAGLGLGARSGFMVGAISVLASNFLFGQGPWTPWQMVAFGIGGLLFGMMRAIRMRRAISPSRSQPNPSMKPIALALIGGAYALLIAGPILDTCSLFMMTNQITPEYAIAIYGAGVPFNAMHALSTFATIMLLKKPVLSAIERIDVKYGLRN